MFVCLCTGHSRLGTRGEQQQQQQHRVVAHVVECLAAERLRHPTNEHSTIFPGKICALQPKTTETIGAMREEGEGLEEYRERRKENLAIGHSLVPSNLLTLIITTTVYYSCLRQSMYITTTIIARTVSYFAASSVSLFAKVI